MRRWWTIRRFALVSATGSTRMGREVAPRLAARFARAILELGGNNCAIVCPSADLELTLRAIAFSAMGTAGQRCTTLRRLLVHESDLRFTCRSIEASIRVRRQSAIRAKQRLWSARSSMGAHSSSCKTVCRKRAPPARRSPEENACSIPRFPDAYYVRPALVEISRQTETVRRETFAPILYVMRYRDFDEALRVHNDVPQGLASSIFTTDLREAEHFLSARGSDCGIANVNIGPSGAEIGGAFGGEKETGGGRESGSDVWKLYMRRSTNTLNYGSELPLAQGVKFEI